MSSDGKNPLDPEALPLSNVAHELLSPLAALRGYIDLIFREGAPNLTARQRTHLETALTNADRLQHFIEDILTLARLDAGLDDFSPAPVRPGELLEAGLRAARRAAAKADLPVILDADSVPSATADPRGLARVIDRLFAHALEYVPAGGSLEIRVKAGGDGSSWTFLERGVRLPEEDFTRLFERFSQAYFAEAGKRLRQSTLALAAAKATVERHGGRLWAEALPEGLAFRFTLPGRRPRVLLADDETDLLELMKDALESDGFDVSTAADGRQARERVREAQPDVAILDLRMPLLSGLELCREIKGDPALRGTRVLLLSAAEERHEGPGPDAFLTKPVELAALLARVRALLRP